MNILITGGFGYIGSRLVKHLHNEGHQVTIGTHSLNCHHDWLTQVKVVFTDWNDSFALEKICNGVDVVIHAAGMNAKDCEDNPEMTGESSKRQAHHGAWHVLHGSYRRQAWPIQQPLLTGVHLEKQWVCHEFSARHARNRVSSHSLGRVCHPYLPANRAQAHQHFVSRRMPADLLYRA